MAKQSKTAAVLINGSERRTQALELRKAGATFKQIGQAMHFSEQHAHKIVTEELVRMNQHRAETALEVTRLELERLDALWLGQWPQAKAGNAQSVDICLKIMQRRARILGLDAPTKIAPTDTTGTGPCVIKVVYEGETVDSD